VKERLPQLNDYQLIEDSVILDKLIVVFACLTGRNICKVQKDVYQQHPITI